MKRGMKNNSLKRIYLIIIILIICLVVFFGLKTYILGLANNGLSPKTPVVYACSDGKDNDGDGFCDYKTRRGKCNDGSILGDSDCSSTKDDTEAYICYPSTEICDGRDNNCNLQIDENNVCACFNGIKDGLETDIDCGGECKLCENYKSCLSNSDCLSSMCVDGVCQPRQDVLPDSCKPLKYEGSLQSHVNIVFVPSGFEGDMQTFSEKAEWVYSEFYQKEPFATSVSQYNAFYVPVEAGSYCNFNCNGIDRLLCCTSSTALSLSDDCGAVERYTVVIHNSTKYGGAGGSIATTSININAPEIAIHELGHSLFGLADEYTASTSYSTNSKPNCDLAGCDKWSNMMGYKGVSCTSGLCYNGGYYSSENTIMRELGKAFEEVNLRATCCVYKRETGSYPDYCSQFTTFGDLDNQCGFSGGGAGAVPIISGISLEQPYEYTFIKDLNGEWKLESVSAKRKGIYPRDKVNGKEGGKIKVKIIRDNGLSEEISISETTLVEYPRGERFMGGYTERPTEMFSVIIDNSHGKVRDIRV